MLAQLHYAEDQEGPPSCPGVPTVSVLTGPGFPPRMPWPLRTFCEPLTQNLRPFNTAASVSV